MVCPLRYIVAACSVALALFVFLWSEYDKRKQSLVEPRTKSINNQIHSTESKRTLKNFAETFTSFFTGRYILDHWRAYSQVKNNRVD